MSGSGTCVCIISDGRGITRGAIVSECLHMGSFPAPVPAVQTEAAGSELGGGGA